MQAHVDPDLCVGAAMCIAIAPDVFELGNDGISQVVGEGEDDLLREAAEECPAQAIILKDDQGNQIYPE